MRKRNSKIFYNSLIVLGLLLVCFALALFSYLNSQEDTVISSEPTITSKETSSIDDQKMNKKVDDLPSLKEVFEKIEVGEEESDVAGSKSSQVERMLGEPDSKTEDYYAGEKTISYSWNYFPWDDPITYAMITCKDGKVISKSLTISEKQGETKEAFLDGFNGMTIGENYSKKEIIETMGYPNTEMIMRHGGHTYDNYTWSISNKIFSIELKDGKLNSRNQSEY
ncbi:hypothetical protein IGI39_002708 [Enterococcus sp. AZ135]|uniref:DUF3862 domain-containing protein n=1 Tax=unclassified Enterococcus TaxID=2608891 RepID=UPI003F29EDEA